jgi:hypothetical protein
LNNNPAVFAPAFLKKKQQREFLAGDSSYWSLVLLHLQKLGLQLVGEFSAFALCVFGYS